MSELEREELLSAYLDGEVSPEERARVEGWLAESPALRQLHDELLSLRADLQSLPRQSLPRPVTIPHEPRGAGEAVALEAASEVADSQSTRAANSALPEIWPGVLEWWQRGSQARRWAWPALAVAAALLILVYDASQRPDEQQVAMVPEAANIELPEPTGDVAPGLAAQGVARGAPATGDLRAAPDESTQMLAAPQEPSATAMPAGESSRLESPLAVKRGVTDNNASPAEQAVAVPAPMGDRLVQPSAAPAAGAVETAEAQPKALFMQKAGPQTPALPTFVCSVTPEYYTNRKFEKLLDANQIIWRRVPAPAMNPALVARSQALSSEQIAPLESLDTSSPQSLYYLQASDEQVDRVLAQIPQGVVEGPGGQMPVTRMTTPRQGGSGGAQMGVQILLVAPTEQQAAPAKQ